MENISFDNFVNINNNSAKKTAKAKVIGVESDNTKALVELIDKSTQLKLSNKTGEILSTGDYVAIEYTSVLSSKTAYISFRNGSPKFTGYYKVLSQTEYDTLEANGQIIDTVMYVIVGD